MDAGRQVSADFCQERHQRIEAAMADFKEWQEKMDRIINGNGHPELGLVHQAYENTAFRKETQDFIRQMNRKLWGAIITGAITGIGFLIVFANYLDKLAR